jgi:hypothetical protein
MHSVIDYLDELERLQSEGSGNHTLKRALWVAALMAYNRCFAQGRRKGAANLASGPPAHLRDAHQRFLKLRDTDYAHLDRANQDESLESAVLVVDREGAERTIEITSGGMSTSIHDWTELKALAGFYRDEFSRLLTETAKAIVASVGSKIASPHAIPTSIRIDG